MSAVGTDATISRSGECAALCRRHDLDGIWKALQGIRLTETGLTERAIADRIAGALSARGIDCEREKRLGPRCRVDLFARGVAIEVKKGRPYPPAVERQVGRYAVWNRVGAVLLVLERSIPLPDSIRGKPLRVLSLNALWGVAP
jgi:hypothetical protein